jgi:membrane protease YdiL (CAAX protease family)
MDSNRDIKNKLWLSNWSRMRKKGFLRFWMIYSLLYFVLSFAVIIAIVLFFRSKLPALQALFAEEIPGNLLTALIFALSLATARWIWNELRFRRLAAKYPSASLRLF